jgi:hypothetical protein
MSNTATNPARERTPLTAATCAEPTRSAETAVLLEPSAPSSGSTVRETPDGSITFGWRVDGTRIQALYPGERLRTDFCMKVAGETRGFFMMMSVPAEAAEVTLSIEEIRSKLGPSYARLENADVEWQVSLALATGGPLFTSRGSDLSLVAPRSPRSPEPKRRGKKSRILALVVLIAALTALTAEKPAAANAHAGPTGRRSILKSS